MIPRARHLRLLVVVNLLAFVALAMASCGASARQTAINTSFGAVNAARDGFAAWDADHQAVLVSHATDAISGQAALDAYRAKRAPVVTLFETAYHAIALLALDSKAPISALPDLLELKTAIDTLRGP